MLFSCSVVSDSLQPHGLQHSRPPCPSLTPGVHSNSCSPRDPRRDSRGERSPWLPLETRPDSPGVHIWAPCLQFHGPRAGTLRFVRGAVVRSTCTGSLSCGAREVWSPCAWRGGARHGSRVTEGFFPPNCSAVLRIFF